MLCLATNRAIPLSHFEHKGRIEPLDRLVRVAALVADDPRVSDPIIGRVCSSTLVFRTTARENGGCRDNRKSGFERFVRFLRYSVFVCK